jgi:biotin operon repressor
MAFDHDDLGRHFGDIWPVHNAQFCDLLITLRRQFGGDLDRMLLLAVIGSRTLAWGRITGLSYSQFKALERSETHAAPINLQSIADYSGIPRETVRRKVQELQRAGWVLKRDDGYLIATTKAAADLAPATEATFRYLVAVGPACTEAASATGALPESTVDPRAAGA